MSLMSLRSRTWRGNGSLRVRIIVNRKQETVEAVRDQRNFVVEFGEIARDL